MKSITENETSEAMADYAHRGLRISLFYGAEKQLDLDPEMSIYAAVNIGYRVAMNRLAPLIEKACNKYPDLREMFEEE